MTHERGRETSDPDEAHKSAGVPLAGLPLELPPPTSADFYPPPVVDNFRQTSSLYMSHFGLEFQLVVSHLGKLSGVASASQPLCSFMSKSKWKTATYDKAQHAKNQPIWTSVHPEHRTARLYFGAAVPHHAGSGVDLSVYGSALQRGALSALGEYHYHGRRHTQSGHQEEDEDAHHTDEPEALGRTRHVEGALAFHLQEGTRQNRLSFSRRTR